MGETRVDLHHLLEDLRDAYPGSAEETIVTEIVANSLDSGSKRIVFSADAAAGSLTVVDDGAGMLRRDLARYHDLATSTKTRGQGIGFAGVGIKLGLLVCEEVVTESRRGKSHVATSWYLSSRHKAPWSWMKTLPGIVSDRGTAVRLKLANPLSPLLDPGFVEATLRRHFESLFDPRLQEMLLPLYRQPIEFEVNGRRLLHEASAAVDLAPIAVKLFRKKRPSAAGWLARQALPLPEDQRGVAVSTYGKVIKRGWDWLGVTPAHPDRTHGLIEAPALSECLTLNKGDFIRTGPRGSTFLAYRRAIQEAVTRQLAEWGDAREGEERTARRAARPVERDLETVLVDLADDFPMLASLVEQRMGGQRKLPMGRPGAATGASAFLAASVGAAAEGAPSSKYPGSSAGDADAGEATGAAAPPVPRPHQGAPTTSLPSAPGPKKPARYGLAIQYASDANDRELARLVDTVVWINEAHAAYQRAAASRSEGYHLALSVAMALAPLAAEPAGHHDFITTFLARWGEAVERPRGRKRRS